MSEGQKKESHPLTGRNLPDEWRNNISKGLKQYYSKHKVWNKEIERSQETKYKTSETCKRNRIGTWNRGRIRKKEGEEYP